MNLKCACGYWMSDVGAPNDTEHLLLSNRAQERLQDLVDDQVRREGVVDMWPEHWEACGALEAWVCPSCRRIYVNPKGPGEGVIVYAVERVGT